MMTAIFKGVSSSALLKSSYNSSGINWNTQVAASNSSVALKANVVYAPLSVSAVKNNRFSTLDSFFSSTNKLFVASVNTIAKPAGTASLVGGLFAPSLAATGKVIAPLDINWMAA
jgi:hypothetical protein